MKLRDKMLLEALEKIERLERRLRHVECWLSDCDNGKNAAAARELNKAADELNAAVAGNPVPNP